MFTFLVLIKIFRFFSWINKISGDMTTSFVSNLILSRCPTFFSGFITADLVINSLGAGRYYIRQYLF